MKENLELERSDIRVDREMEIDPDNSFHLYVYLETWFDVLKKFDLTPWDDEDTSLDLYAVWNPITDYFICEYVIKSGNGDREYELYTPTENETKLMKEMIAETLMEESGKTPTEYVCELEEFDPSLLNM